MMRRQFYLPLFACLTALFTCTSVECADLKAGVAKEYLELLKDPEFRRELSQDDIYLLRSATGTVERITNSPATEESPSIDDSGSKVAFCFLGLYLLDLRSRLYTLVVPHELGCGESKWIPGKSSLSFSGAHRPVTDGSPLGTARDLYIVAEDGTKLENITNTPDLHEYGHDWSPDGISLAYVQSDMETGSRCQIWIQRLGSSNSRSMIAELSAGVSKLAWGSEGTTLYYTVLRGRSIYQLASVDIETGQIHSLPADGLHYTDWDICASTGALAYSARPRMGLDKDSLPFSGIFAVSGLGPQWSNDGSNIVFMRADLPENFERDVKQGKRPESFEMVIIRTDGTIDFGTDVFNRQTPIVTEFTKNEKGYGSGALKNLTKKGAADLLSSKSLTSKLNVDDFEWEE